MKIISIYSSKGGVGKTTMSILLASWLKYEKGERVLAYDFESPESRMMDKRNADLTALKMNTPILTKLCEGIKEYYPMAPVKGKSMGFTDKEIARIVDGLRMAKESGEGYIICDFPGRYQGKEPVVAIVKAGLIDLMAFPVQPEDQSITSLFIMKKILSEKGYFDKDSGKTAQDIMCFWNMISRNDKRGKQDIVAAYEDIFKAMNIPCAKTRINYVDTVKRSVTQPRFVTTTVCYPRLFMQQAFPPSQELGDGKPYIENLFEEIKARVDGASSGPELK